MSQLGFRVPILIQDDERLQEACCEPRPMILPCDVSDLMLLSRLYRASTLLLAMLLQIRGNTSDGDVGLLC